MLIGVAILRLEDRPPPDHIRVKVAVAAAQYDKSDPSKGLIVGACGIDEIDRELDAMEDAMSKVADFTYNVLGNVFAEIDIPRRQTPSVTGRVVEESK